jgi:hypothetical protein
MRETALRSQAGDGVGGGVAHESAGHAAVGGWGGQDVPSECSHRK